MLSCFTEILVFNANNFDTDQTPGSGLSDLGLYCSSVITDIDQS